MLSSPDYYKKAHELPPVLAPRWMAWTLWVSVVLVLVIGGLTLCGPMDEYVTCTGEVRAADFTIVFSSASGVMMELLVREGQMVKAGEVVARLAVLREDLLLEPQQIRPYEIKSPADGRVMVSSRIYPGEKVDLGRSLFKLVRGEERELRLYATEDRIDRIEPGQEVRFRSHSSADRLAAWGLARVAVVSRDRDLSGDADAAEVKGLYRVKALVEKAPYELPLGAKVDAEIVLRKRALWEIMFLRRP